MRPAHDVADGFTLRSISERFFVPGICAAWWRQQACPSGPWVLHVGHGNGGVADAVVHHRVHSHRHAVLGQGSEIKESLLVTLKI
ncbi:hypothetical protein CEXT_810001 [Caerostris extrusa]|uniref:Uncharacterized protein n=1 Tax=Caerostris extrusa TaxID=172846 RepID=A0AAV4UE80_CAEEX|nr:hypothetical protein CEXT_810001 [Caerostris extrusa]